MALRVAFALAVAVLLEGLMPGRTLAAANPSWEAEYRAIALRAVEHYDRPQLYTYAPRGDVHERAAVTVALNGQVLLEGYRTTGNESWLDHARIAADSLLAHGDMNHDGKLGWGRYWPDSASGSDGKGGASTFSRGCVLPPNRAYDDEIYDDAYVTDFLLDLYGTVRDRRYLDAARQVIENTWNDGAPVYGGTGFMYWKTIGACSRGWYIKNINMLMAVPMARLAKITGERRYDERFDSMMRAELHDVRHSVDGRPAPNLGYYALETMHDRPEQGKYVQTTQTAAQEGPVVCNLRTGSGRSCLEHLPIEAGAIDAAARIAGNEGAARAAVLTLMNAFQAASGPLCSGTGSGEGSAAQPTACVAYYCALRGLAQGFDSICHARVALVPKGQDLILGLLRGQPER